MPKSTYYHILKATKRSDKYSAVKEIIQEIFIKNRKRYGHRRINAALLQEYGIVLNHKTVMRLMNDLHLFCPAREKHKHYCKYGDDAGTFEPNILQRQFTASEPYHKWTTDITEFKAFGKKLYLSVILDMYNGEIVNYTLTDSASLASVQELLTVATMNLPKDARLIFHSDRGWHYQQRCIKAILTKHGIVQSMSRRGECYDNAIVETFFATLKNELFYVEKFKSIEHLSSEIHEYIRYYNNDRIRAKLNYLSPIQFRLINYPIC